MTDRQFEFVQAQFAGKATMVDRWFGRVLNRLDREGAWDNTVVVVTTDHGNMLGEHGYIMKNYMPVYDEIANTPLMVWHPEGSTDRVQTVTSAVDLYATMLDGLGAETPEQTHSRSLTSLVTGDTDEYREYALYGYFGRDCCVTDGRYTYLLPGDDDTTMNIYSTMQMGNKTGDAETATLPYTDGAVWKYPSGNAMRQASEPMLFDTDHDPGQTENIAQRAPEEVDRMHSLLVDALDTLDAPDEQYERFGIER